ncbi:variant erythrocyte surface antigen-1 family protein [Babesia caballi]|uniref:Variant erythrocyte surface antigen-1 family protein n=1 Tax=Babesia caballi TaxID=5871 RepID=A0AAV4LQC2_BABCB|nr:variant erythrocyte surface antigen-1 family protein [Babesia caballi]
MKMTTGKNSLTQPPKNLKEAIDWVLCMSEKDVNGGGRDAIKKLAEQLISLLTKIKVGQFGNVHGRSVATLLAGEIAGSSYSANYKPIESFGNVPRGVISYSSGEVNGGGIGKPGGHQSSYSDSSPSNSVNTDEADKHFIALIPLIFFGLGGGVAAAYLFDIGGAKTLVNGLFKIG